MKLEFTFAQLCKLSRLSPESWRALTAFVKEGGSGDFTPDLQPLKEAGLVSKVGPCAYVKFQIDGALPTQLPISVKRNKGYSAFGAFLTVWRRRQPGAQITGKDLAALKRFVNSYALDEFEEMVRSYCGKGSWESSKLLTLHGMWAGRTKFQGKRVDGFSGEEV